MTIQDTFQANVAKRALGRIFERTFGVPLSCYFDNFTGFDILKFDDQLIKAGTDESVRDAVERLYGLAAVELIEKLIH